MPKEKSTVDTLFALCKKEGIKMVDVKFVDLQGGWRVVTLTMDTFTLDIFKNGTAFDGSSIPGFQTIVESDLILIPIVETAFIDPFHEVPTLSILAEVKDPLGEGEMEYKNNPRYITRKALEYMRSGGIADELYIGPEIEFNIFDDVQFSSGENYSMYAVDSNEGYWNNELLSEEGNLGFRPPHQGGYFRPLPIDTYRPIRNDMVLAMQDAGITVERHHHEVGGTGEAEINIKYDSMLKMADTVLLYKYIVKNVAASYGRTATFMPKAIFNENGNGMHCHQSLWKKGKPLFYDKSGYAGLSELALHYIGGLLKHAKAVLAFGAPTTNSYRRLTPGFEAPVVRAYSKRNRSAAVRVPVYHASIPAAKRIEFRSGDPAANPYLYFPAMLLAGLDGIQNKIDPGEPHDQDLFDLTEEEVKQVEFVPSSLDEALQALEEDHEFLTQGDVFTEEFIEGYIAMKKEKEVDPVRLRPHPHEFTLYYTI